MKNISKEKFERNKWDVIQYYTTSDNHLEKYANRVENMLQNETIEDVNKLNEIIVECANVELQKKYRRKTDKKGETTTEPPWINDDIRQGIKKRKQINRAKRGAKTEEERNILNNEYLEQKRIVQQQIKTEMYIYEKKITRQIKESADKSKMWDYIKKLQGKNTKKDKEMKIYDNEGEELTQSEAVRNVQQFWRTVYQKQENDIINVWTDDTKQLYTETYDTQTHTVRDHPDFSIPPEMREHMDMAVMVQKEIMPMTTPTVTEQQTKSAIQKLKNNKSPGPDGCKSEFYKALLRKPACIRTITRCLNKVLETGIIPPEWKTSNTTMIPKQAKPTAKDLRPIALTNYIYKIFMSILKEKIEDHLTKNEEQKEVQAGFTKGARIEDNIFILQYCIEQSYRQKKTLVITSVDYSKAFDSIKREKIVEVLVKYKIHPLIISAIVNIYQEDKTTVKLSDGITTEMTVTSGIRQGCTGSTTIFKLITYLIVQEMERRKGYSEQGLNINTLFYADDSLQLSHSVEEARRNIRTLIEISRECGLEINKDKSRIIIHNPGQEAEENPESIEGISVTEEIKYLGLIITNKRDMFKTQKNNIIQKAQKLANMTYSVIAKSCHKITIGKTFWKSVCLPSILYGTNVLNFTENEINKLQRIENSVYRQILGAPKYAQVCTLRGEVGSSNMKSRIIEGRLLYLKSIIEPYCTKTQNNTIREESNRNSLVKEILRRTKAFYLNWMKTTTKYFQTTKITYRDIETLKSEEIKNKIKEWDTCQWKKEVQEKSSLHIYKQFKLNIASEEELYDNTPASITLYKARSNNLNLNDRKRFQNEDTSCIMCTAPREDLEHFVLHCPGYVSQRVAVPALQQPYPEECSLTLGHFLFTHAQTTKQVLYQMWKIREKKRHEIAQL